MRGRRRVPKPPTRIRAGFRLAGIQAWLSALAWHTLHVGVCLVVCVVVTGVAGPAALCDRVGGGLSRERKDLAVEYKTSESIWGSSRVLWCSGVVLCGVVVVASK